MRFSHAWREKASLARREQGGDAAGGRQRCFDSTTTWRPGTATRCASSSGCSGCPSSASRWTSCGASRARPRSWRGIPRGASRCCGSRTAPTSSNRTPSSATWPMARPTCPRTGWRARRSCSGCSGSSTATSRTWPPCATGLRTSASRRRSAPCSSRSARWAPGRCRSWMATWRAGRTSWPTASPWRTSRSTRTRTSRGRADSTSRPSLACAPGSTASATAPASPPSRSLDPRVDRSRSFQSSAGLDRSADGFAQLGGAAAQRRKAGLDLHASQTLRERGWNLERARPVQLFEPREGAIDDVVVWMAEQPIQHARIVRQRVLLQELGGGGVERLGILDGVQLLAGLVALVVLLAAAELLADVIGERGRRHSLREEAFEVGLVLRVLGGALEPLRLPIRSPRRATAVALLVDLAPAPGALRLLVVRHGAGSLTPPTGKVARLSTGCGQRGETQYRPARTRRRLWASCGRSR